jgi:2,3-bisphosphoglycerate-independent phosphoglycerate mutase
MISGKKYAVLIGDGMADKPLESIGFLTPLEYAKTPNIDYIAENGIIGMARTVPAGIHPGSDTANLSIFGYDPTIVYTGRAPLEALNMDIDLGPNDVAFRCNMVDIRSEVMHNFTAGHIDSSYSSIFLKELSSELNIDFIEIYPGVSYRNIMIWRDYPYSEIPGTTPPHDIQGLNIDTYLPEGSGADLLKSIMIKAAELAKNSKNIIEAGKKFRGTPTSVWLWGGGKKPQIQSLKDRFGLVGNTISAVDLIHGIGRAAGLTPIFVEGATGYLDTNYEGKADALLMGLESSDIVFLHVESPDESGHEGNLDHKLRAIEDFDKRVVGRVIQGMRRFRDYQIIVLPDHPTPISLRTHTADPVPFAVYDSGGWQGTGFESYRAKSFSEKTAEAAGLFFDKGHHLLEFCVNMRLVPEEA